MLYVGKGRSNTHFYRINGLFDVISSQSLVETQIHRQKYVCRTKAHGERIACLLQRRSPMRPT
jgi:hypothetical protein